MISKSSGNPVDGSFESGPEGKAQCFVSGVLHAAGRPHGFTGGVRQLEVSIHCLETKETKLAIQVSAAMFTTYKKEFSATSNLLLI